MEQGGANTDKPPTGCLWGCLGLFLIGIALCTIGFRPVGQAAIVATFVLVLAQGLRSGEFHWNFTRRTLKRRTRPLAFWSHAALLAALACGALWYFLESLRSFAAGT
jgi:hypothetical protein